MIETPTEDNLQTPQGGALATPVAPEDIRVGDYVAEMNVITQYVMRGCDESDWQPGDRAPRLHLIAMRAVDAFPRLFRVLAIGLPFVYVEDAGGTTFLLTCRLTELARVPEEMGKRAMRDLDRRRRKERREKAAKRRAHAEKRRAKRDEVGAGAEGAD